VSISFRSLLRFMARVFPGERYFTGLISPLGVADRVLTGVFLVGDLCDIGDFPTELIGLLGFKKLERLNSLAGMYGPSGVART
jgi:hypothetical protein